MGLGGSDLSGAYAISPQVTFEIPFQVRQTNGLSPNASFIVGLSMIGAGLLCVLVFIILNKKYIGAKG